MKFVAIVASVAAVAAAGPAGALEISDTEYLNAVRCHALAGSSLIGADTAAIDALLRDQSFGRSPHVQDRAKSERSRAARQARSADGAVQAQLRQEVVDVCQIWLGGAENVQRARAQAAPAG